MFNTGKTSASFLSITILGVFLLIGVILSFTSKNVLPTASDLNVSKSNLTVDSREVAITAPRGNIQAEIADTPLLEERGLSGRTSLGADRGMLFAFKDPGIYGFWMKDMNFPLDMVWVDANHKVVSINSHVLSSSYPNTFFPPTNISYVLELNAGAARQFGIATGTELKFVL